MKVDDLQAGDVVTISKVYRPWDTPEEALEDYDDEPVGIVFQFGGGNVNPTSGHVPAYEERARVYDQLVGMPLDVVAVSLPFLGAMYRGWNGQGEIFIDTRVVELSSVSEAYSRFVGGDRKHRADIYHRLVNQPKRETGKGYRSSDALPSSTGYHRTSVETKG